MLEGPDCAADRRHVARGRDRPPSGGARSPGFGHLLQADRGKAWLELLQSQGLLPTL